MAVKRNPWKPQNHPHLGDTRAREAARIKESTAKRRLIEARLDQGIAGFCEWCDAQGVLAWSLTDQSILLGLVLAKFGPAVRNMVRDSVL